MEIIGISEVELVCVYGPGDNYNPCNRGRRQHITKDREQELKERYSEPEYGIESWECPQCGNHALRVNSKTKEVQRVKGWDYDPGYWRWI